MNQLSKQKHSIDSVFSVILFGLFVLFLLLLLIISSKIYTMSIHGLEENQNLHTAASYITVKFRQHDSKDRISISTIEDTPVLCFTDHIDDTEYYTYIYLQDQTLKELFTSSDSAASLDMGTPLATLTDFSVTELEDHFFSFSMTDIYGKTSKLLLHAGTA